jgi:hypothetical protein
MATAVNNELALHDSKQPTTTDLTSSTDYISL